MSVLDSVMNKSLTFVTSIRYNESIAKMLDHITFLYDPNWIKGSYEEQSLPLCFYFVRKWGEVFESSISQKPMMFYNASGTSGGNYSSVMDVVADNHVLQPKQYKADILLPYTVEALLNQWHFNAETMADANAFTIKGLADKALSGSELQALASKTTAITSTMSLATMGAVGALKLALAGLVGGNTAKTFLDLLFTNSYINKQSLEAMRDNRSILKMKMWTGWRFKYVVIKSIDLTKSGEYEGFYEGSIVFQELPIINVGSTELASTATDSSSESTVTVINTETTNAIDSVKIVLSKYPDVTSDFDEYKSFLESEVQKEKMQAKARVFTDLEES